MVGHFLVEVTLPIHACIGNIRHQRRHCCCRSLRP